MWSLKRYSEDNPVGEISDCTCGVFSEYHYPATVFYLFVSLSRVASGYKYFHPNLFEIASARTIKFGGGIHPGEPYCNHPFIKRSRDFLPPFNVPR